MLLLFQYVFIALNLTVGDQTSLQSINDFKSRYQHLQQIEKCKDTSITSTVPDEGTIDTSTILTPLRLQTM